MFTALLEREFGYAETPLSGKKIKNFRAREGNDASKGQHHTRV